MRLTKPTAALIASALLLSGCATPTATLEKRRGLEPTEANDGGLRQAPPPPEDGESADTDPAVY